MPPSTKQAATLLLMRPDGAVFWARRPLRSSFLATFHVFPGGAVDATDASPAAAAVRETREETGIEVAESELLPAGRFLTPPFSPIRFDTFFFIARAPERADVRLAAAELEGGEWIQPEAALERWRRDEAVLAAPTRATLEVLARTRGQALPAVARALEAASPGEGEWAHRVELRPGVFVFPVRTPTLPPATHTNTVIMGDGADLVVIDPASPYDEEREALAGFVAELGREGRRVKAILLTHRHHDHVAGAEDLAARTKAPIVAHPLVKEALRGEVDVTETIEDGHVLELGRRRVRAVLTEGHARGHLAFHEETSGTVMAGDMIAGYGTIIIDPPEGDMKVYFESLARLRGLGARLLFPSHGPPIGDPTGKLDEYVAHRLAREAKVLGAYEQGARDLDAVVKGAYQDTPPALHGLAARSALAHLLKLQAEGRVPAGAFALPSPRS